MALRIRGMNDYGMNGRCWRKAVLRKISNVGWSADSVAKVLKTPRG
jgi:hypothetical protein